MNCWRIRYALVARQADSWRLKLCNLVDRPNAAHIRGFGVSLSLHCSATLSDRVGGASVQESNPLNCILT